MKSFFKYIYTYISKIQLVDFSNIYFYYERARYILVEIPAQHYQFTSVATLASDIGLVCKSNLGVYIEFTYLFLNLHI